MKKGYAKVHHGTDPHAKRPQESAMHVLRLTKEGTYDGRVLCHGSRTSRQMGF